MSWTRPFRLLSVEADPGIGGDTGGAEDLLGQGTMASRRSFSARSVEFRLGVGVAVNKEPFDDGNSPTPFLTLLSWPAWSMTG